MHPSAKEKRDRQLESGKRDFYGAIVLFYPLLVLLSPVLGLASAVLYALKFTIAFTSGSNYHNKMKKVLIESLYNKKRLADLLEEVVDEGVEQAYTKYGKSISESPDSIDLVVIKNIAQEVTCQVAAVWFFHEKLSTEEKVQLRKLASDVTGLLNEIANAGLVVELHGILSSPTVFLMQITLFPFKSGTLFSATRRMEGDTSEYLDSFRGRVVFVLKMLSGRVSDDDQHPLLKGMLALKRLNAYCLDWTKSAKQGSFLHEFTTEVSKTFKHLSKKRREQMVASNAIFLLGALLRATVDEFLIVFESLFGVNAEAKVTIMFYELLRINFEPSSTQLMSKATLAVAEKWGDFLNDKTTVQNVDRPYGPFNPHVPLASAVEKEALKALPFSTMLDKNNCPGKRLAVLLIGKIFLKFKQPFQTLGEMRAIKIVSQSKLTDAFYRVDNLVDVNHVVVDGDD